MIRRAKRGIGSCGSRCNQVYEKTGVLAALVRNAILHEDLREDAIAKIMELYPHVKKGYIDDNKIYVQYDNDQIEFIDDVPKSRTGDVVWKDIFLQNFEIS